MPLTVPLVASAVAGAALPSATSAQSKGCIAPDVVGVSLAMARDTLNASGCSLQLRQLPAHGHFVTPSEPDKRQLVGSQRPGKGARTSGVTLWLKPLCSQPAEPGPETVGPSSEKGPTELIAGLFLDGGPLRLAARCKPAKTAGGTLTVATSSGQVVAQRAVRPGSYGVFPLKPGSYVVSGTLGGASSAAQPRPRQVKVLAKHSTRLNLVVSIP